MKTAIAFLVMLAVTGGAGAQTVGYDVEGHKKGAVIFFTAMIGSALVWWFVRRSARRKRPPH